MEDKGWKRFQRLRQTKLNKKLLTRKAKRVELVTIRHAHKFIVSRWENIRSVRYHIIGWLFGVALLIGAVGFQDVWARMSYQTVVGVRGGVYAEAVRGPLETLNPLYAMSEAELSASHLLFSGLYDYDQRGHLRGDLATNMTQNPNGKEYVVTLRQNVQWHDGKPLTADDVAFTIGLIKDPSTRAAPALRAVWRDVVVTPLGERTVKFVLPTANAAFPQALTFSVLPQHLLQKTVSSSPRASSFSNAPVGSGPFKIRLIQQNGARKDRKIIMMSANERYYRGVPMVSRFQLHVFDNSHAVMTALKTGEVNAAADISSQELPLVDTKQHVITAKPVNSGVYALFNTTTSPMLKEAKIRKALQVGIDLSVLRRLVAPDLRQLDLPFVSSQVWGDDVPKAPVFNQAQAGTLLDQAGWTLKQGKRVNREGKPLVLRVVTIKNPDYEHVLDELGNQWRRIGITIESEVVDPAGPAQDFTQRTLQPRNYDVLVNRLAIGADPDVYAYWHSSQAAQLGRNYANYNNAVSDDALTSALSRSEPELRNAKYKAFARQWLADAPAIGLYQANMYYAHTKATSTIADDEKIIFPSDRYGEVIHWTVEKGVVYRTP